MFRIVNSKEDRMKLYAVRAIVFCGEQSVSYEVEIDQYEDAAIHILGEIDGEPIASGRIRLIDQFAKIERLAIRKAYRQKGYGKQLLQYALSIAREQGYTKFKLHAQIKSERFYAKQGFKAVGDEFIEADIVHRLMIKEDE